MKTQSSIASADTVDIKYNKALKQIQKLIAANRALREKDQKNSKELIYKINELSLRNEDLTKQYEAVRKQKDSFSQYIDELQKEKAGVQRENRYLNDLLHSHNAELQKLRAWQNQHTFSQMIKQYEERQENLNNQLSQKQLQMEKFRGALEKAGDDLQHEKCMKEEYENRYWILSQEMQKYKDQNSSLLSHIERLIKQDQSNSQFNIEKEKQLKNLTAQFSKQLLTLKKVQDQNFVQSQQLKDEEQYNQILIEKNRLKQQLNKLHLDYQSLVSRQNQYYEMQQKVQSAQLQLQEAIQNVNMLKNRIVILEAKQFIDEVKQDNEKQFELRIKQMILQNDPLAFIKNGQDNSHFLLMKSFLVDLQEKVLKFQSKKNETIHKYKNTKAKFIKLYDNYLRLEQNNRMLKVKMQGYQNLAQKLHIQLSSTISQHQNQILRITNTANKTMNMKAQQHHNLINLLNVQLESSQKRYQNEIKNYKQSVQTLKEQINVLRQTVSLKQQEIRRNSNLQNRITTLQRQCAIYVENIGKLQNLFNQQRQKNQMHISQKQQLSAQKRQISQQNSKLSSNLNGLKERYEFCESQLKKKNQQYQRLREQLKNGQKSQQQMKRLTTINNQLQNRISQLKLKVSQKTYQSVEITKNPTQTKTQINSSLSGSFRDGKQFMTIFKTYAQSKQ